MRPKDLSRLLMSLFDTKEKRPTFIWGPPGCGKSQIVRQVAAALGVQYKDIRLPYCEPGDIKFPIVRDGGLSWVNSMFPEDRPGQEPWRGLAVLEELPQATAAVQASVMQAVLDKQVGDSVISPGCMFVACGNRVTDRAGAGRVLTPVLNRFIHIDLETSREDWTEWAIGADVDARVVAFIQYKPELLHRFDPEKQEREFPTHRSWEFASDVLKAVSPDLRFSAIKGCIGEAAAAEFVGFLDVWEAMTKTYPVDRIVSEPDSVKVPPLREGGVLYALGMALADRCRSLDKKVVHNAMKYAFRMDVEFAIFTTRSIVQACQSTGQKAATLVPLSAPGASEFFAKHKSIITG
jgi:MoxR-like ATPase